MIHPSSAPPAIDRLRSLMQQANIPSYRALAVQAQVSRWQVQQLRSGNIGKMRVAVIAQIANALNISVTQLLSESQPESQPESQHESQLAGAAPTPQTLESAQLAQLQQEYQRLQLQLAQQENKVRSQVQSEALQTLDTWLDQWPTIVKRVQDNPDKLLAIKLLPQLRPLEQLISDWGVEAIAPVDAQVPYNPQLHQLTSGAKQPGDLVQVTHSGHQHQGKLLHRAKVKPIV
ncbi:MAG: Molecular chaperone GrpE (heat shock protein) [Phormidesmis priestleyi Ana]|uniref:Molecular chaperone GrpE (Heat shock protein) n=1 Tax=Phormidesmis priestleyi Ana TaxID=1666911 RepID=A0A0N8KNB7_9CYAN|nr:MAG: Molecular chaperone GrpE (heat shock protein) [Phormidesmis priestleyi Ana]